MNEILNLMKAGLVSPGTKLTWHRRLGETVTAVLLDDGCVVTGDGVRHKSLSGAAKHYSGKPVDGWNAWKLPTGKPISSLRKMGHPE